MLLLLFRGNDDGPIAPPTVYGSRVGRVQQKTQRPIQISATTRNNKQTSRR